MPADFDFDNNPVKSDPFSSREGHRLPEGTYLAVVDNLRIVGREDRYFFLDFSVPGQKAPDGRPMETFWSKCPERATGGNGLSRKDAVRKDQNKVRVAAAAAAGYSISQASEITTARFDEVLSNYEAGTLSPLAGRKVFVTYKANKARTGTYVDSFTPYLEDQPQYVFKTPKAVTAAPAVGGFEAAAAAAGWKQHPHSAVHWFRPTDPPTTPAVTAADLAKNLGF